MGQLSLHALVEWLVGSRWASKKSVCAGSNAVGLQFRVGGRSGGQLLCGGRGHRDRRVHHVARRRMLARGSQAHHRPREPQRHHPHRSHAGHRRAHGAHRHRRGCLAWCTRWRRPAGRCNGKGTAQPAGGLPALPRRGWIEGRTHRRGAKEVHRLQPRRGCALRNRTRRDEGAGCGDRRPR